jgi:hypothetical protein
MRIVLVACVVSLVAVTACRKAPPAQGSSKSATTVAANPMPAQTEDVVREKKPRLVEAAIYLDGTPIAAIRSQELPSTLKLHASQTGGAPSYYMGEYLTALGIDVAKVKGLHVYGGSRVAAVDGDEFRRVQNGIHFSFSRSDGGGKPRIMFAVASLKATTTVDMISAISVYVDKEPPIYKDGQLMFADGKPIVGIPYAPEEISKGTRVYVDGKLTATVKRKDLPNGLLVDADTENPHFSLPGYLTSIGVDAKKAKAMDFVSEDDVILRMDGTTKDADTFAFTLPRHNQGHIAVPAGGAKAAKVSALQIFIKNPPPARTVVQPKDDVLDDAKKNSGGGQGAGGGAGGGADDEL